MKVLVLLSGGCESTALLEYGKRKGYDMDAIHASFSVATEEESEPCRKIAKHYGVKLFFPLIDNSEKNKYDGKFRPFDIAFWLPLSAICALTTGDYDEVWFGNHSLDNHMLAGKVQVVFEQMMKMSQFKPKTIIDAPLRGMTKQQQWDSIPKEVQKHVVYCWKNKGNPCGECKKCVEWKEQGLTR